MAADTVWTGGAGPREPFWDLASNWSAGPPGSTATRALLGDSDTILRQGTFVAQQVSGQGRLTFSGGNLALAGPGSAIGHLDLAGGMLRHGIDLTVGRLDWRAGGIVAGDSASSLGNALTVNGPAFLSGTLNAGNATRLQLNGAGEWKDGASSIDSNGFTLALGPRATFHDHTSTGEHSLSDGRLVNEGRYLKTGAGTSSWDGYNHVSENRGLLEVLGGRLKIEGGYAPFYNFGTLRVENASMVIGAEQGGLNNSGTLHVGNGGRLEVSQPRGGGVGSTGVWTIESGGWVDLRDTAMHPDLPGWSPSPFKAGAIRNDGTLIFRGGEFNSADVTGAFVFSKEVAISGRGRWEAVEGVDVRIERDLQVGRLRIAEPKPHDPLMPFDHVFSRVGVAGAVTVDRLDWEDGFFDPTGPVTVRHTARLSNDHAYWKGQEIRRLAKEIKVPFTFLGRAEWDGKGDLFGTGTVRVAPGARFEDRNEHGTLEYQGGTWAPRLTLIDLASFQNQGRYVKTGAATTLVRSRFDNRGSVQVVDAAPLLFAGALENTGTLEAVRSRIVVWGPLAQLRESTLTAGRYVARDGTLVLQGAAAQDGVQPAGIYVNRGGIVLDGPQARISTVWFGMEQDALRHLNENHGELQVLNGARLTSASSLYNRGQLAVSAAGVVQAAGFKQDFAEPRRPTSATWIDGTLQAQYIWFSTGDFGPGTRGGIGVANLVGDATLSESNVLMLDIQDAQSFDRVRVSGSVELQGVVRLDFLGAEPPTGTFRVLTAVGGIEGRFRSLESDLDPARYRLDANYTPTYLELTVTAAPEPGTWSLMLLGGVLLVAARRLAGPASGSGRPARTAPPPPQGRRTPHHNLQL
ncbi:hypothetical protein OOT46_19250 [Aquabacterium sp. A7-Y]|uniref:PEP-CTERM sorting domain-containing protein n=1 Tax=Aquabacterium sp. A7-Y TaxID=1349605 RepID=UPI00223CFA35|nr:PEP-CTERM sorting domain-containing protein [Aquabacterium sp. A7-Y]MCW7539977.1 hypothetical protein [Aquabacterium sp. A7-Y]